MNETLEWIKGFLRFVALAVGLVAFLAVLDWIPGTVDRGGMRRYSGIEQLRREPGFGSVLVPSYYPEEIKWPPRHVLGQKVPFMAVVMEFDGEDEDRVLVISESSSAIFLPGRVASFSELRQSVNMDLKGRDSLVETGLCHDGAGCSRLSWNEGDLHVKLFMRAPSVTLIRIADSMLK